MKLYIAEKPSLARALAEVLPKPQQKSEGFITLGNGDIVSWCVGHLLEQAEPEAYDPAFKKWRAEHLPIIPKQWQLKAKATHRKQLGILKKLIGKAHDLVHVGDPDREGQILIDEVINFCGASKAKIASTQRCLISDLNPQAVQRSLANLKSNREFIALSTSALARARADWLYGINMTRLCTLQGQKYGFSGVLSIGRVQTPILGLVVRRDHEIENFVAKPFYELEVDLKTNAGFTFAAKWQPSAACESYMDEEKRVLLRALVENVAARVINQPGEVSKFSSTIKKQAPPLPYNLSALQIDAAKAFNLSAKQALDICQQLYERHKLITYPRSDCRFLPTEHFNEASQVINAIEHNASGLATVVDAADLKARSKAWNDKKVGAHHAIIPTSKKTTATNLSSNELLVYTLIARQYLMQFLPSFDYRQIQIDAVVAGGNFIAKRKELINLGWKMALPKKKSGKDDDKDNFVDGKTPSLKQGDALTCIDTRILDKTTSPPKRFNDASLLSAMTGIARYVKDADIRKILRDTDGLGTEATRAGIIELLFTRDFLRRQGKEIRATEIGRELIDNIPEQLSLPDMTAQWESQLDAISKKNIKYMDFMSPMTQTLHALIAEVSQSSFHGLKGKGKAPARFKKSRAKKAGVKPTSTNKAGIKKAGAKRYAKKKASV